MRTLVLAALLAMGSSASAARPAPVPGFERAVMTMQVDGDVEIGPTGEVVSYTLRQTRKPLPPVIATRLPAQVKQWRFDPVLVDGKAVRARTRMRITLLASEQEGGFSISIDNVTFPRTHGAAEVDAARQRSLRMVSQPKLSYPPAFIDRGLDARVLVALNIAPDGTLTDAAIVQSSIPDRTGKAEQFQQLAATLEREVLRGVRAARFAVDVPLGADNSEPVHAVLPIEFRMGSPSDNKRDTYGQWRVERRSDKRAPTWLADADRDVIAGVSDLNEGETSATDGAPRLRSPVRGAVL